MDFRSQVVIQLGILFANYGIGMNEQPKLEQRLELPEMIDELYSWKEKNFVDVVLMKCGKLLHVWLPTWPCKWFWFAVLVGLGLGGGLLCICVKWVKAVYCCIINKTCYYCTWSMKLLVNEFDYYCIFFVGKLRMFNHCRSIACNSPHVQIYLYVDTYLYAHTNAILKFISCFRFVRFYAGYIANGRVLLWHLQTCYLANINNFQVLFLRQNVKNCTWTWVFLAKIALYCHFSSHVFSQNGELLPINILEMPHAPPRLLSVNVVKKLNLTE